MLFLWFCGLFEREYGVVCVDDLGLTFMLDFILWNRSNGILCRLANLINLLKAEANIGVEVNSRVKIFLLLNRFLQIGILFFL